VTQLGSRFGRHPQALTPASSPPGHSLVRTAASGPERQPRHRETRGRLLVAMSATDGVRPSCRRPFPGTPLLDAGARAAYIDAQVIAAFKAQEATDRFDRAKLLRLIDELNDN
jgi:hypothetical protein